MKRRTFMTAAAGAVTSMAMPPMSIASSKRGPMSAGRLYDHVQTYTAIGEHRTGTTGDRLTAEWIESSLRDFGYKTKFHPVTMNLFEVTSGFLEVGQARFRADPEWYPTATPPAGVRGQLHVRQENESLSSLAGKIEVIEVQMRRPVIEREIKEHALKAAEAGAVGVVMLLTYRSKELTGRGAHGEYGQAAWCPIPLVAVAGKHEAVLRAAERGETARLVVRGREQEGADALNVTGELGKGKKQVIVTTPQSGMFRCGGERAGGIAMLLGLAEWVAERRPDVHYHFATNTGHEQSGSGARLLLETAVPPPEDVVAWLHLGAGVCSWRWRERDDGTFEPYEERSGIRNFGAVPALTPLLDEAFSSIPDLAPQSERFAGELRAYVEAGYPGFGFWGYNRFGHTVADGPEHVSPAMLERVGASLCRAFEMIEERLV